MGSGREQKRRAQEYSWTLNRPLPVMMLFRIQTKMQNTQFCYLPVWRLFSPHDIVAGRGNPIQGPRVGSFLTQKCIVWEDTHADKARDFTGKGCLGREPGGGSPGGLLCLGALVSGFMVVGLVSRLSVNNLSDSGSFLVVHIIQLRLIPVRGVWEVGRTYRLTSPLSVRPLLNSFSWW